MADLSKAAGLSARERGFAEDLVEVIGDVLAEALKQRDARIAALEQRLAQLERQKGATLADAFQGPHLAGRTYQRGHVVQRNRKTWLALVTTSERPGDSSDWRELALGLAERAG